MPEILLTMIQEGVNTSDIISSLVGAYDKNDADEHLSLTDNLVTELPFASELVHLESLTQIMKKLEGRDFYKRVYEIVKNSYFLDRKEELKEIIDGREHTIHSIHKFAKKQITAEGNAAFNVLMTEPIHNLIKKYRLSIPNTVIMGAKGAGKAFLYREILRNKSWEKFILRVDKKEGEEEITRTLTVPLFASGNAVGFQEIMQETILNYNKHNLKGKLYSSVWLDNNDKIVEFTRNSYDKLDWKDIWKSIILASLNKAYRSFEELDSDLEKEKLRVVFLIDGLEEIFQQTIVSETEQNAIVALCRDTINEIKIKYKNLGLMIFLRKDMVRDSIAVNFEQFNSLYHSVELRCGKGAAECNLQRKAGGICRAVRYVRLRKNNAFKSAGRPGYAHGRGNYHPRPFPGGYVFCTQDGFPQEEYRFCFPELQPDAGAERV